MPKRPIDDNISDEEPEDHGTFQRATEKVLKTRVIKKAVRRNKKGTGLFNRFKGCAKTTTAGKYPFSFLSRTSNASDAKEKFTFCSPIMIAQKAKAKLEKWRHYVTKQKQSKQSLTELLKTQIDENPTRDLTPLFNHYLNYLKEMDKDEDKLDKLVSNGAQKASLMVTPFSEFTFKTKPFSTLTILILCVLVFLYSYVFYE